MDNEMDFLGYLYEHPMISIQLSTDISTDVVGCPLTSPTLLNMNPL